MLPPVTELLGEATLSDGFTRTMLTGMPNSLATTWKEKNFNNQVIEKVEC